MSDGPSISKLAQLFADPARAAMLNELMGGRALTATELANVSNITRQTASSHLSKLQKAELLVVHAQGRHKYFRLANEEVADVLERLTGLADRTGHRPLVTGPKDVQMRKARSCYDHLAGPLAVEFYAHAVASGWFIQPVSTGCLSRALDLTEKGEAIFTEFGFPIADLKTQKRALCRACLDWSERRDHLAGALGSELLSFCVSKRWAKRETESRVVKFTGPGEKAFRTQLCGGLGVN